MKPIRINADASIDVHSIDTDNTVVVIDDFLSDPGQLVDFAVAHSSDFEEQSVGYPGVLYDVPADAMTEIHRFLRSRMSPMYGFLKGGIRMSTYLSMATRQPGELSLLQRLCHSDPRERADRRNYAGLVYLFDEERLGGTGFYRWKNRGLVEQATAMEMKKAGSSLEFLQQHFDMYRKEPRYMSGSNDAAELLLEMPARFNRFLFYPGDIPHSAHIPEPDRLSTDFSTGRLTLNCFASVKPI